MFDQAKRYADLADAPGLQLLTLIGFQPNHSSPPGGSPRARPDVTFCFQIRKLTGPNVVPITGNFMVITFEQLESDQDLKRQFIRVREHAIINYDAIIFRTNHTCCNSLINMCKVFFIT